MNNQHEIDKIKEYENRGYTASYKMVDGKLVDLSTEKKYDAADIKIVDEYRYEGLSNPSDMSILYILEIKEESKGTILIPYGPSGDTSLGEFMKEVSLNELNKDKSDLNKVN